MADSATAFQRLMIEGARMLALRMGRLATRYGELFTSAGRSDADPLKLGLAATQIAVEEAGQGARDLLEWELAYYRWLAALSGVTIFSEPSSPAD